MSSITYRQGDASLADAFRTLADQVIAVQDSGTPRHKRVSVAEFTYLMTSKQFDRIRSICMKMGWPVPNCRGIHIDYEAIAHPLHARIQKDNCTVEEVLEILIAAYCGYSEMALNKPKHSQGILFNRGRRVKVGKGHYRALAVYRLCEEKGRRFLAPITAFHTTDAKIRKIV
ncbi:hypothetical protein KH389_26225 [Pseudomonas qingdaonensis]|jgi:hypothetical protein|uniref:NinB protein n=1 Tax=Pseudomonas qingdaonensis TaxID=2056231 RepID=A0ABX8DR84_9PSED|nr:hypothetical protein [Pseudomonas qingdaonensis]QVL18817.1 hypothetical protein KH389_26225 [Pseudomonas qingdaonensis]